MKKVFLYALLFAIPGFSFSQSTSSDMAPIQTDYLKKSKNQKTAAWALLGGGFALATTSVLLATPKAAEDLSYGFVGFFVGEPVPQNDYTAESILLVTGTAAMLGSIPLFIASKKNKKRVLTISANMKMENTTMFQNYSFIQSSYPAVTLKIKL